MWLQVRFRSQDLIPKSLYEKTKHISPVKKKSAIPFYRRLEAEKDKLKGQDCAEQSFGSKPAFPLTSLPAPRQGKTLPSPQPGGPAVLHY